MLTKLAEQMDHKAKAQLQICTCSWYAYILTVIRRTEQTFRAYKKENTLFVELS